MNDVSRGEIKNLGLVVTAELAEFCSIAHLYLALNFSLQLKKRLIINILQTTKL